MPATLDRIPATRSRSQVANMHVFEDWSPLKDACACLGQHARAVFVAAKENTAALSRASPAELYHHGWHFMRSLVSPDEVTWERVSNDGFQTVHDALSFGSSPSGHVQLPETDGKGGPYKGAIPHVSSRQAEHASIRTMLRSLLASIETCFR